MRHISVPDVIEIQVDFTFFNSYPSGIIYSDLRVDFTFVNCSQLSINSGVLLLPFL